LRDGQRTREIKATQMRTWTAGERCLTYGEFEAGYTQYLEDRQRGPWAFEDEEGAYENH
jgi:hypothetical protein